MNILVVAAFALLACCASVILKRSSEPISVLVSVMASLIIICAAIASLKPVIEFIKGLQEAEYSIYYTCMLKGLGIAILAESASDICKECGEESLGTKVELAAKVSMLLISLPLLEAIISLSKEMMSK